MSRSTLLPLSQMEEEKGAFDYRFICRILVDRALNKWERELTYLI